MNKLQVAALSGLIGLVVGAEVAYNGYAYKIEHLSDIPQPPVGKVIVDDEPLDNAMVIYGKAYNCMSEVGYGDRAALEFLHKAINKSVNVVKDSSGRFLRFTYMHDDIIEANEQLIHKNMIHQYLDNGSPQIYQQYLKATKEQCEADIDILPVHLRTNSLVSWLEAKGVAIE